MSPLKSVSLLLCEVWMVALTVKSIVKLTQCSAHTIHMVDDTVCSGLLLAAQLPPLVLSDVRLQGRSHWSISLWTVPPISVPLPAYLSLFNTQFYICYSLSIWGLPAIISFGLLFFLQIHLHLLSHFFSSSVQSSRSVMSDSLWPHGPQHTRPPCLSPTPGVYSNSLSWSQWCHSTISSSVTPFSSCPQSFPASGAFQMSQLFASRGQSIGVSASTSVLPMNTQDWSPLEWTGWISLKSKGLSRVFSNTINSLVISFLYSPTPTSIHDYWKNHSLD